MVSNAVLFQSTHPVRGATGRSYASGIVSPVFQSTHPVRGATRVRRFQHLVPAISLHAPREGCDTANDLPINFSYIFQSTHPVRGATNGGREGGWPVLFQSTHPARGATGGRERQDRDQHISIHAPREGCDDLVLRVGQFEPISIHAPREGCDVRTRHHPSIPCYFNPRTP